MCGDEPVALRAELRGEHLWREVEHRSGFELPEERSPEAGVKSPHGTGHRREEGQRIVV